MDLFHTQWYLTLWLPFRNSSIFETFSEKIKLFSSPIFLYRLWDRHALIPYFPSAFPLFHSFRRFFDFSFYCCWDCCYTFSHSILGLNTWIIQFTILSFNYIYHSFPIFYKYRIWFSYGSHLIFPTQSLLSTYFTPISIVSTLLISIILNILIVFKSFAFASPICYLSFWTLFTVLLLSFSTPYPQRNFFYC